MNNPNLSNRNALLSSWNNAAVRLAAVKAEEAELRKQVIAAFSEHAADTDMFAGMETIDIGWGKELKVEHKLDYKLDKTDDYAATDKALDEIEKLPNGELLVDRLVKRTLDISIAEYKKLPPEAQKIIDKVLTIKPASKSVKMQDVKAKP